MNRENFAEYLRNPSRLYQLSYAELKSLVLEYPYSPNLRLLLLLKARLENDPRAGQILESTAAHAFDRGHLYRLLRETVKAAAPRMQNETEEVLELKALAELDAELERLPIENRVTNDIARALHFFPDIDLQETEDEAPAPPAFTAPVRTESAPSVAFEPEAEPRTEQQPPSLSFQAPPEVLANAGTIAALDVLRARPPQWPENTEAGTEQPDATERGAFLTNAVEVAAAAIAVLPPPLPLFQEEPVREVFAEPRGQATTPVAEAPKPAPTPPTPVPAAAKSRLLGVFEARKQRELARLEGRVEKKEEVADLARQSFEWPFGVASETLARVLVEQGNYDRAETMYRELSLLFPEKSAYFAAIIEELKQMR